MTSRGAFYSFAPLALALGALLVRELTRANDVPAQPTCAAHEFVPPASFLAATRGPGVAQTLRVDDAGSRALVAHLNRDGECVEHTCVATGTLRIAADGATIELELALEAEERSELDYSLLRVASSRCSVIPATGARAGTVRARLNAASRTRDTRLDLTWLRLPGGRVRLHGVIDLDDDAEGERAGPWWDDDSACARLAFDLTLTPERGDR